VATAISDKEISLSWSASTDNVGVTGYRLYRDGHQIASTASTSYHDSGLSPSTAYHYTVAAADGAGNLSQQSAPVTVTTNTGDSTGGSSSGTLTFISSADTYVQPGISNRGSEPKLWIDGGSEPYEILLKFSVSGVGAEKVTDAKLRLYAVNGSDKGGDFYRVSDNDWTEHGVTWDNAPAAEGNPLVSLGSVSSDSWIDVDVTPLIDGDGIYSLRIKTTSSNSAAYYAKEQEGFAPKLVVAVGTAVNTQENTTGNADSNDRLAPSVTLTRPAEGSNVSNTTMVEAKASDNIAIAGVQFKLDNSNLGKEDTTNSYSYSWDTTTVANGSHTLTAVARDIAGNTAVSEPISITVNNSGINDPNTSAVNLVTDGSTVFSVPQVSKPAYLAPVTDPTFGTKITRITGNSGAAILNIGGKWGSDARHHYSKDQPWNSNGTLLALQNSNSPSQIFLDGKTYEPKYARCPNYDSYEDRWHPSPQHPNERINLKGSTLNWFDVVNCTETRRWQLPFAGSISEGNTSIDGRYFLIFDTTRMVIVDMDPQAPLDSYASGNKRIGPVYDLSKCGLSDCHPDWVSISPSGKYAVAQYKGDHTRVFDVNPKTLALTPRLMPSTSPQCGSNQTAAAGYIYNVGHADMTLNPFDNNEDVIVGQRRSWCPSSVDGKAMGTVVMVRLKDNTVTTLVDPNNEAYAHHISTRNYDRPGWAYVGYYPQSGKRFNDEIIAVKLDGSKTVERLAHQHSNSSGCYRCEPHPVPSRDGRRVLWASNWTLSCGSGCGSSSEIKAYVVDTRR
jgi:chitodextrinase